MKNWFDANLDKGIRNLLLRVEITLQSGEQISRDFSLDLGIDYETLEEELQITPSIYAFWSAVLAEQKFNVSILDSQLKYLCATKANLVLEKCKESNMSLRRSDISDIVESDEEIVVNRAKLAIEQRSLSKLFAAVQSLQMKSEHLRSLAGFKRQEQQHP